jgi:hypothetical protein
MAGWSTADARNDAGGVGGERLDERSAPGGFDDG